MAIFTSRGIAGIFPKVCTIFPILPHPPQNSKSFQGIIHMIQDYSTNESRHLSGNWHSSVEKAFCCSRLAMYKQNYTNWGKLFFFSNHYLLVIHFFIISFDFLLSTFYGTKVHTMCTGSYAPDKRDWGSELNLGLPKTTEGRGEGGD